MCADTQGCRIQGVVNLYLNEEINFVAQDILNFCGKYEMQ
jgi:hypothetical protein